ncbi:hypothetical protein ANCDUO_24438, partial [Ancylostoma duodenale]
MVTVQRGHTQPSESFPAKYALELLTSALCRLSGEPTMGKDYKYGAGYHYGYSAAPTAPSMEITINQNGADSKNPYQAPGPVGRGRPPLSAPPHPPPPPPSY